MYPKEELFFAINGSYTDLGDYLFPYITHLGGGFLSLVAVFGLLLVQYRLAIIASASFLLSGLITQILKRFVFPDSPRPFKYFEDSDLIHTIADVDMYSSFSFPSGHTTTVFSLFFMLALCLKKKYQGWGVLCALFAILGGYSRVYLGQHFPTDVLAGSAIGVLTTYLCYRILDKLLKNKSWASRALVKNGWI